MQRMRMSWKALGHTNTPSFWAELFVMAAVVQLDKVGHTRDGKVILPISERRAR